MADDEDILFDGAPPPSADGPPDGGEFDELDESLRWEDKNDAGNAIRLKARFGDDMRFVPRRGWHVWDGKRWYPDLDSLIAMSRAKQTAACIQREANSISLVRLAAHFQQHDPARNDSLKEAEKVRNGVRRWSVTSGNQAKVVAMLASAQPEMPLPVEELDRHPYLFNVENGTLDLKADVPGMVALRDHDRADHITALAPVTYDPEATAPTFRAFIDRILPDAEVQGFVQRYFGYILTGSNDEQCLAFFLGRGANGKSTLIDVMAEIMGDYCRGLPVESLLHNDRTSGAAASPDLARLPGARMVRASEPEVGARFSTSILKEITGGEKLTVRELYKEPFEFSPEFKMIISANNKPQVRGGDDGIWRRIHLVPFPVQVPKAERDPAMKAKLLAERAGILNWMLDGYRLWQDMGSLKVPEVIRAATDDYRDDQDPVSVFLRECVRESLDGRISARRLHDVYTDWCTENGLQPVSLTAFGRMVKERGLEIVRSNGTKYDHVEFTEDAPVNGASTL